MQKGILMMMGCLMWSTLQAAPSEARTTLWYDQPVPVRAASLPWQPQGVRQNGFNDKVWESRTLPLGNGRMGATAYSGVELDCLTLNEVSLWSGGPNEPNNGSGYAYGPKADKNAFGSYQPFADLYVQYDISGSTSAYKRSLSLDDATLSTEFCEQKEGGVEVKHSRVSFVSKPDDVLVYHAEASGKEPALSAKVALLPYHDVQISRMGNDTLCLRGTLANGEKFEGRVLVRVNGGSFRIVDESKKLVVNYEGKGDNALPTYDAKGVPYISISGAESFTLLVTLATDYKMDYAAGWKGQPPAKHNDKVLKAVKKKSLEALREAHLEDYHALYSRMSICLGTTSPELAALPTDARLRRYRDSQNDPELEATVYQYGRYVLISGSRPGNLPVNLQGIWNNRVHAPWASDYHNNINLQMCYWGAEVGNLSECHLPLIHFINAMQKPLAETTRKEFGQQVRGWTTRISQNPWGAGGWTKWNPPVNAWYALHVWDHYLFTQDENYLRKVAYPILKNICNFWEDHLKELGNKGEGLISGGKPLSAKDHPELGEIKKGALVAPSGWSHEWGPVEDGVTHDQQLIWELFDITARAAKLLKVDNGFARSITEKKNRLVGNRIAPGGYLQEWIVDRPNMVNGHRHTSHLIGVYPGSTISPALTPDLAKAAMKSLELRGLSGDNRRSWTWPWRTALWARFNNADQAYLMVKSYLMYNALDNLFGNHPPMQMDGTYGMTGGMSEMLVQSHAGRIELLPALPEAWNTGSVRGLRARGNITINMSWEDGKVTSLDLTTSTPNPAPVQVIKNGEQLSITPRYVARKTKAKKDLPAEPAGRNVEA